MHPGLAALLAALASAEVVVVRPIAAPVAPLGVVGAPLAAAAKVHAPSALQLAVPAVQPVRPGGAGRSVVTTLGLARDAARRIRPLAGATLGTAGELARTFDGSEPLASAPPEPRDLSTVRSLRFGTYNMLNLFEKVGKHVLDPDRPGRLKRISDPVAKEEWQLQEQAKAILDNDLDVMSVQEVENVRALQDFVDRYLHGRYKVFLIEGNDERGIDVAFLVKEDLPLELEHLTHKNETWHDRSARGRRRVFSRDLPALVVKARGRPLFILLGTHYKSKRGDDESRSLRRAQVETTVAIIRRLQGKYGEDVPLLLAGDFNGDMNHEPEFEALRRFGLIDSLDALANPPGQKDRITHTYHPRGGAAQAHQIDAIMILPSMKRLVRRAFVHRYRRADGSVKPIPRTYEERSQNPSDHFPVVLELEFQPMLRRALSGEPLAAAAP